MESYVFGWLSCTLKKIELFLLAILCHEFRVSLYFDLLCHFCLNFVELSLSVRRKLQGCHSHPADCADRAGPKICASSLAHVDAPPHSELKWRRAPYASAGDCCRRRPLEGASSALFLCQRSWELRTLRLSVCQNTRALLLARFLWES